MSEPAVDNVVPFPRKPVPAICANGHNRVVHYETACPLCIVLGALAASEEQVERLRDELHYAQHEAETLRDQLSETE